ncbi:MAG: ADP-ribosylation factor-like protein [Promethearchaeota archaeon]
MEKWLRKDFNKDLKALFKSNINVRDGDLEKILDMSPDALRGIDSVSADKLADKNIKTIYDLSQVNPNEIQIRDIDKLTVKKWVRKTRILVNYIQNPLERKKLLLAGLDYAGKTSLLSVLKKNYSVISELLPTIGAQRDGVEFFGVPIITWDLGGQALYRKDYLNDKKSKLFFSETDVLFYVIDIQDEDRYDESIEYFSKILDIYDKLSEKPSIIILFHKTDPNIESLDKLMQNAANLQLKIADISTNHDIAPTFANTSIYDVNSVFNAFSLGIRNISQTAKLINALIEEYCIKTNGIAAALLSSEGEVFAQTGTTKEFIDLVTNNGFLIGNILKANIEKGLNPESRPVLKFTDNEMYLIGNKITSQPEKSSFLWLLIKNLADFTSQLKFFKKEVEPLINLFIV